MSKIETTNEITKQSVTRAYQHDKPRMARRKPADPRHSQQAPWLSGNGYFELKKYASLKTDKTAANETTSETTSKMLLELTSRINLRRRGAYAPSS